MKRIHIVILISIFCIFICSCGDLQDKENSNLENNYTSFKQMEQKDTSGTSAETSETSLSSWRIDGQDKYSKWLCGMVENDNGSDVVVINPQTNAVEFIDHLDNVAATQACALSPNGELVAYSQFITDVQTEGMYLTVKNIKSKTVKTFFKDSSCNQLITDISWLKDNKSLLLKLSIKDGVFYSDILYILNTETVKLTTIDQGKFMAGNSILDEENKLYYYGLSQNELDFFMRKYGNSKSIPVNENGGWNYVDIANPTLSPDGQKILYNVTFNRNVTPAFYESDVQKPHLWLASGIWIADVDGETPPKLIFGNNETQSNIGKSVWTENPNQIIFNRYYDELTKGVSDVEIYDISSNKTSLILKSSAEHETNIPRCSLGKTLLVMSDGNSGEKAISINLETNEISEVTFSYKGKNISIWRFNQIV
jgi:hypothetical protein